MQYGAAYIAITKEVKHCEAYFSIIISFISRNHVMNRALNSQLFSFLYKCMDNGQIFALMQ